LVAANTDSCAIVEWSVDGSNGMTTVWDDGEEVSRVSPRKSDGTIDVQSCRVCKDREKGPVEEDKREPQAHESEAEKLRSELGIESSSEDSSEYTAAQLRQELGIAESPAASKTYTAAQLRDDVAQWEEQEQQRRNAEERQRQLQQERERLAAIDRAKRAEILREQQMSLRQQRQEEERQRQATAQVDEATEPSDAGNCRGFWGTLGCAAKVVSQASYEYETTKPRSSSSSNASSSSSGSSERTDYGCEPGFRPDGTGGCTNAPEKNDTSIRR